MRAVLVADDRDTGDAVVRDHPPLVFLAEKRIEALEDSLAQARDMPEPDRRTEDEDVGVEDAPAQGRPVVAFALVAAGLMFRSTARTISPSTRARASRSATRGGAVRSSIPLEPSSTCS
jgi:hypothetical protein